VSVGSVLRARAVLSLFRTLLSHLNSKTWRKFSAQPMVPRHRGKRVPIASCYALPVNRCLHDARHSRDEFPNLSGAIPTSDRDPAGFRKRNESSVHANSCDTSVPRPGRSGHTLVTVLRRELGARIGSQQFTVCQRSPTCGLRFASKTPNPIVRIAF